ncbi:MAG TPA: hypothetical protein VLL08_05130 [Kineosporiaceae bacterium]|nr:hypothetical protein [Kineosporiaceae bacterium]
MATVLFETIGKCERGLTDISASLLLSSFGLTDTEGGLEVEDRGDEVLIHLYIVVQGDEDNPSVAGTEFEFRVSVAIADAGWRVWSLVEARLVVAVEGHAPGRYVLHEGGSPALGFELAMEELHSQVEAFAGHADRLDRFGLERCHDI